MNEVHGQPPTGVVTLVLGDLERSVDLWDRDGESMAAAMARADELVDDVARRFRGARPPEQGEGDNFVLAFEWVSDAVSGACELQRRFADEEWPGDLALKYRVGVHTGELTVDATNRYEGPTINRCARIRDLAHGGQTLLSGVTAALAADVLPEGATTMHLGAHELRGMTRPEDVHQLCHEDLDDIFPPIVSGASSNLPAPASTFIGRSDELAELHDLVSTSRVVTLTGAGGSGKSRLALEVARTQHATTSTWLVELASIQDPLLVPRSVADALRVDVVGGTPAVDAIERHLRARPALLVLDNCEHLLDACADLTSALTKACPDLVVVATSREPLGIDGEVTWRIPSLSMPDAVTLFADRAQRGDTGFELTAATARTVEQICERVDRLPLAIELAAARCRALSVDQVASGLSERFRLLTGGVRDALPRQRSLEASVAWSYELLSPFERAVLARLSVFAGPFDLDGATAVASGGEIPPEQVLDRITSLVDRSLVQVDSGDPARYRLLETIRVYARERLAEIDDPDEVRDRHLQFAMQLASTAGAGFALDAPRWAPILRAELDNLRAAIEWARTSGRPDRVIDLIQSLGGFWQAQSMQREIDRALRSAIFSDAVSPSARARGMAVAVPIVAFGSDVFSAFDFANDAYALALMVDDLEIQATAAAMRAWTGMGSGRGTNEQIGADIEATLLGAENADPLAAATLLLLAGSAQTWWSGFDDARITFERALEVAPADGFEAKLMAGIWLLNTGADGRVQAFRDNAHKAIQASRALDADSFLAWALQLVGFTEALYGHERPARRHVEEAVEVATRAGPLQEYFAQRADAIVELRFGPSTLALTKAVDALERSHDMRLGVNERIDYWLVGAAARRAHESHVAREHLESALALSIDPAVPFVTGRAHLDLALLDLADDEIDTAWDHAHDALETLSASGDRIGVLDALDVIAAVAANSDTAATAARLLGATDAARDKLGVTPFTMTAEERTAVSDALTAELDDPEQHRTAGARLNLDDTVAYARRGRGERNRPTTGWQSLSPTELRVVELVADGLQNAQIAEQLLMSVNTVKSHLSHAYTKLGLSSRTQLVAEATARQRFG